MNDDDGFIAGIIVVAVLIIACMYCGYQCGVVEHKSELVKQGYAEYYLDNENNKQWRMKETK